MRRLKLWLLIGTALFNLCFWLLVCQQYQLQGFLLGYPSTVWVGSVALVLLAYLTVSVRQTRPPLAAQAISWHALRDALTLFVVFASGAWVLACVWWVTWLVVLTVLAAIRVKTAFNLGLLFAVLLLYAASVLFFQGVARLLQAAALPKPVTQLVTTLVVASVGLVFVWSGAWGFFWAEGDAPSCSQRFVSPSGQRTLVRETRDDSDGEPFVRVYVESGWWLQEIPVPPKLYGSCTDTNLKVQWRADEKQVTWQNSNGQGYWQW